MRDRSQSLPIEFQDVTYAVGNTRILNAITLVLSPGPPTLLLGPNGSGKTTLLKLAMGLLTPVAGRILYAAGAEVARRRCAIVFQKLVMNSERARESERTWKLLRSSPVSRYFAGPSAHSSPASFAGFESGSRKAR